MSRKNKHQLRQRRLDKKLSKYNRNMLTACNKRRGTNVAAVLAGSADGVCGLSSVAFPIAPKYRVSSSFSGQGSHCRSVIGFLLMVMMLWIQSSEAFDVTTLANIKSHLEGNFNETEWEINESGFVRWRMSPDLLSSASDLEVNSLSKLRMNYWYKPDVKQDLQHFGDESAHDHPNGFTTYMLKGGYSHELFERCKGMNLKQHGVKSESRKHFQYNKKTKALSQFGLVTLRKEKEQNVRPGMRVSFDDKAIHRIKSFQPNTMTLNAVRNDGKQKTNIYVVPDANRKVKTNAQRRRLIGSEAEAVTRSAINILEETIVAEQSQVCRL